MADTPVAAVGTDAEGADEEREECDPGLTRGERGRIAGAHLNGGGTWGDAQTPTPGRPSMRHDLLPPTLLAPAAKVIE